MQPLTSILCIWHPEDSFHALSRSIQLAAKHQAKLTVLHVIEELPADLRMLLTSAPLEELQRSSLDARREQMELSLAGFRNSGLACRARVVVGIPFLSIIREVIKKRHDLVVKSTSGKPLASDDAHLLRKCPCPVWLVRGRRIRIILAALEPWNQDEIAEKLNTHILGLAAAICRWQKADLHMATVWQAYGPDFTRRWGIRLPRTQAADLDRDMRRAREKWLAAFAESRIPEKTKIRIHCLRGEPCQAITQIVRQQGMDLLVMGSLARPGIPGWHIGRTAENLAQRVECSLLTVKPAWFVSPVTTDET